MITILSNLVAGQLSKMELRWGLPEPAIPVGHTSDLPQVTNPAIEGPFQQQGLANYCHCDAGEMRK